MLTLRHTPYQVKAADTERSTTMLQLQSAYKWTVSQADQFKNKVKPQRRLLGKLIREGHDKILTSGPASQQCFQKNFKQ
jgi:hypothetical protein